MDIVKRLREGRTEGTDLQWTVTDIHREAADQIARLRAIEQAARAYYRDYCQDEADEDGICDVRQQMAARALRDALRSGKS